jgi:hypothetical protein
MPQTHERRITPLVAASTRTIWRRNACSVTFCLMCGVLRRDALAIVTNVSARCARIVLITNKKRCLSSAILPPLLPRAWEILHRIWMVMCSPNRSLDRSGSKGRSLIHRGEAPHRCSADLLTQEMLPLRARHEEKSKWHCPPGGEADAHTRHLCPATMRSRAPSKPCLIATFLLRFHRGF